MKGGTGPEHGLRGPRPCPPGFNSSSSWRGPLPDQHPPLVSWPNAHAHIPRHTSDTHPETHAHPPRCVHTQTQSNRYDAEGTAESHGVEDCKDPEGCEPRHRTLTRAARRLRLKQRGRGSQPQRRAGLRPWRRWLCCALCLVVLSCPTLCDPVDCSPPGSSVHGDSPEKNTGVGCHALFQGIFPTQGSNPGIPHCRQVLYRLSHQGSPREGGVGLNQWISNCGPVLGSERAVSS